MRTAERTEKLKVPVLDHIDEAERIALLEDDSFRVFWANPQTGELEADHIEDIWGVALQTRRVIDQELGKSSPVEGKIIGGEVPKMSRIAADLETAVALKLSGKINGMELARRVEEARKQIGSRVKNSSKVAAYGWMSAALNTTNEHTLQVFTLNSIKALFGGAARGSSIATALLYRAGTIQEWINYREQRISALEKKVGSLMREIDKLPLPIRESKFEEWADSFSNPSSSLHLALALRGNPYARIVGKPAVRALTSIPELARAQDLQQISMILETASFELQKLEQDKKERLAP